MLKRLPCSALLFLSITGLSFTSAAQEIAAGINIGYATFNLGDLKEFQQELSAQYPFDAHIVESFPGYLNFSASILFVKPTYYYGVIVGHTSTAGRLSYSDYSGSFTSDQLVGINSIGTSFALNLTKKEKTNIFLGGQTSFNFNNLVFNETIIIGDTKDTNTVSFRSVNFALTPFIEVQQRVNNLVLRFNVGGEIQVPGDLTSQENNEVYLVNSSNEKVKFNASGLRMNIGIAYSFKK